MLFKSTLREIKSSITRYLAIAAIVGLGVGFFAGLKMCKPSMVKAATEYIEKSNMYDYQLMSTYGIDKDSVKTAEEWDGVTGVEVTKEVDAISDIDDASWSIKWITLPEKINKVEITGGRMPENKGECLVDESLIEEGKCKIGSAIDISNLNKSSVEDEFKVRKFKVVGSVTSCLYLDYQRGSTDIGDGSLEGFVYVKKAALDTDVYSSLYVLNNLKTDTLSDKQETELSRLESDMKLLASQINDDRREKIRKDAQDELDEKIAEYNDALAKYQREREKTESDISDSEEKIKDGETALSSNKEDLNRKLSDAKNTREGLQGQLASVNQAISQLEAAGMTESDDYKGLLKNKAKIEAGIKQCDSGIEQINNGLTTIDEKSKELAASKKALKSGKAKAEKEFNKAEKELSDAKVKIDDAQQEIDDLDSGRYYAFSREDNAGYSSFRNNSEIVSNIAKIFPLFFFLVAILVCMTTMTRMIEEQRTQIGVLKALGYSNASILGKYLFYSGSAAASGAIIGFFLGCKALTTVIWNAYTMMYEFSDTVPFVFDKVLFALSIGAALLCAVGATWISVANCFKVVPADLIRPKTPPSGKRVLLERITLLWSRLSFLYKVSLRNVFRYKKRFFMMLLGISGCTALLIAGFGIDTTVSKVAKYQYSEISTYDYQVVFNSGLSDEQKKDFIKEANDNTDERLGEVLFLHQASADLSFNGKTTSGTCVASYEKDFDKFINLHDGDRQIAFPKDGEAVIAKKLRKEIGVETGDTITLKEGYRKMTVKVADACDFYVGEDVFVNMNTYMKGMDNTPSIKTALVKAPEGLSADNLRNTATKAGEYDKVSAVIVNLDMLDKVDNMMESLNLVVYVVILCAGLLAFIVIFNLTNINILERIREIATIKVLGFNQKEVSQYVFRENLILSALASLVGIPLGKWLLNFVIDNIVVSMIYFEARINPLDYVYSVLLTVAFALIVNLSLSRRLDKISMTESLKSIE